MKPLRRACVHLVVASTALASSDLPPSVSSALACGRLRSTDALHAPSLSVEEVLIVWDAQKKTEHFVREIVFSGDSTPFGFVVPTPTRPEVEAVKHGPFVRLDREMPFRPDAPVVGAETEGRLGGSAGVRLLEKKRVGSFTAFVLAATDHDALTTWMKDNRLASDPATDAWLAHYVELGFHFAALRYEPSKKPARKGDPLRAETLRISFPTPAPYYPYSEPLGERGGERVMALWLMSTERWVPVSLYQGERGAEWVRPFREGPEYPLAKDGEIPRWVGSTLDDLVPSGTLRVQTFEDQKTDREGFGDVVFVPEASRAPDEATRTSLAPLLPLLDPKLGASR